MKLGPWIRANAFAGALIGLAIGAAFAAVAEFYLNAPARQAAAIIKYACGLGFLVWTGVYYGRNSPRFALGAGLAVLANGCLLIRAAFFPGSRAGFATIGECVTLTAIVLVALAGAVILISSGRQQGRGRAS